MLSVQLADKAGRAWCQQQVIEHHYLHRPVDARCSVLAYQVVLDGEPVGCLMFGRPESTRCYSGDLRYGSLADVEAGRAAISRWQLLNLARVWLDPRIQIGGCWYVANAATQMIGAALRRVVFDYLQAFVPCFADEPWMINSVISYCDTRVHSGTVYRAAGFRCVRRNEHGIETYSRPARPLKSHEQRRIRTLIEQSQRSQAYRRARADGQVQQLSLEMAECF